MMRIFTIKRPILFGLLGLALLAFVGLPPTHVKAAPLLQTSCTLPATVTTADQLYECITAANAGSGGTITLGADIDLTTLTTSPLPNIASTIVLDGAGYAIDGGWDGVVGSSVGVGIFVVVQNGDLTVNQATLQNGNGYAIYNFGTLFVTNSTFYNNLAGFGAIYNRHDNLSAFGTATITNSTFSGNHGGGAGGAINNTGEQGRVTVTNSTFSGNSSTRGGAIHINQGQVTATGNTFSGNSASVEGDAIYSIGVGWRLYLAGNIFVGSASGDNCRAQGTSAGNEPIDDNGYNLSDDITCTNGGTGSATNATLPLGALADNGGATQTHLPSAGSDAIDAIPSGATISNNGTSWTCNQSATDQRGESRPINSGDGCTAGAVEVALPCPTWTVTTTDELRQCVLKANGNESPSPTADTITLGADINLTSILPQITSEITVEGAGHFIDGGNSRQIFDIGAAGDLTVKEATLQNGRSGTGGGAIYNDGMLTLINSTLAGNTATTSGGAIFNATLSTVTVVNSTFSANSATNNGGAIYTVSTLILTNSTIAANTATEGSGIYLAGGQSYLAGTIFAGNTTGDNCTRLFGTPTDNGYNLSDDATCTTSGSGSVTNAALNLGGLADNGGPTQTHLPGPGSAAIGAIPNGTTINNNGASWTCNAVNTFTDQRGEARPLNSGDACTSGAVEVAPPQNVAPVAVDDDVTTDEDVAVTIDVLANDTDANSDSLTVASVTDPTNGSVVNNGTDVTYTPDANYNGSDSFSYTVSDGNGGTDMATVLITVNAVNDAPVANDDSATTDEDTAVIIDVLVNDTDIENDTLTVESVTVPTNGSAVLETDGTVTYTPNANYNGNDSFSYIVSDGNGGTDMATVSIMVNAVNDAPVANDDSATTDEDMAVNIAVLPNDTDVEGDALTAILVSTPSHGTVTLNPDGSFTYTPSTDFSGSDSFTYKANDGALDSNVATVNITVNAVNDAPTITSGDSASVTENQTNALDVNAIDDNDTEGTGLTFSLSGGVDQALFTIDGGSGVVSFNSAPDFEAPADAGADNNYNIQVTVADSGGLSAVQDIIITVTDVDENSAPTAAAGGPYLVDEGSSVTLDSSGSTDAEQDPATLSYAWDLDNDGDYDDDTGINPTFAAIDGPATVTVGLLVTDEGGLTSTESAAITINNVAPTIANVSATQAPVAVGAPINASGSFSDPGVNDTHTGTWDWGDGSTSAAIINGGTVGSDSHAYTAPGIYTLKLMITDNDGDSAEQSYQFVVVYDPSVGFVTGGGTIDSPAGAYVVDPSLTGKANFGFVAKYKKGQSTPDGNTQFQFKIADLQFHSNAYEWLVVASGGKAMFKGTGTINGAGNYGFLISAIDADIANSTDVDLFRIKIWDRDNGDVVLYDNQLDADDDADPTTAITGGNIKIHQQGGGNKANSADADTIDADATNGENNRIFLPLITNSD